MRTSVGNRHNIAIVGCGTAGQAAALFLCSLGHSITIFEKSASLGPIGAGLLLQPAGMTVLQRLGAAEEVAGLSSRVDRLLGTSHTGKRVLDLEYRDWRDGAHGWGVHRGALFTVLQRLIDQAGIEVRLGVECASIRAARSKRVIHDNRNQRHGPFDLIIVADGAWSGLARKSDLLVRAGPYPWGVLWFVGEDARGDSSGTLRQVYHGTREMIGFLPSGRASVDGPSTVSLFWSIRCESRDRLYREGLDAWKETVRRLTPLADPLLPQVRSMNQLIFASYCDTVMRRWDEGPIVYLGDAAHAMSPQLGQGVNLALIDAAVLSECVSRETTIEGATARYSAERRRHVRFYQFASRWLTPIFQSYWPLVGPIRDLVMGRACRMTWARRQMLDTLAGVKDGFLSRSRGMEPG